MMSASNLLAEIPAYWPEAAASLVFGGVSAHWGSHISAKCRAPAVSKTGGETRPAWWLVLSLLLLFAVPLVPFEGRRLSLASIGSGMLGEFSALTVLLVITSYLEKPFSSYNPRLFMGLMAMGWVLYTSVLTYTQFDVYRLGYAHAMLKGWEHWLLPAFVALWALFLPMRLAILLVFASVAWMLGLQGSTNYWDYLLDVPLFLYAAGMSLKWFRKRMART